MSDYSSVVIKTEIVLNLNDDSHCKLELDDRQTVAEALSLRTVYVTVETRKQNRGGYGRFKRTYDIPELLFSRDMRVLDIESDRRHLRCVNVEDENSEPESVLLSKCVDIRETLSSRPLEVDGFVIATEVNVSATQTPNQTENETQEDTLRPDCCEVLSDDEIQQRSNNKKANLGHTMLMSMEKDLYSYANLQEIMTDAIIGLLHLSNNTATLDFHKACADARMVFNEDVARAGVENKIFNVALEEGLAEDGDEDDN